MKNEWPNGNSKLSHLSKWWKLNGQMGTVNWVTWANSENEWPNGIVNSITWASGEKLNGQMGTVNWVTGATGEKWIANGNSKLSHLSK